ERFGHVLDLRQIVEVLQTEANQELLRRGVEEWTTDDVLAANDLDQVAFEQRREDTAGVDATNLGDLERRDRLFVGNHRQRLETLHGELLRRALVKKTAHPLVQVGTRDDLITTRNFDHLQARTVLVVGLQRGDRGRDVFLRLFGQQLEEHLRRDRFRRREDQRLDDGLDLCADHGSLRLRWSGSSL